MSEYQEMQEKDLSPSTGFDEKNIRHVSVPIPAASLREYFENKELFFIANYSESKLKGEAFLTYLTNLNVPCDVKFDTPMSYETYSEILLAYMNQNSVIGTAGLHVMAAEMLLIAKGMPYAASPYALPIDESFPTRFVEENKDLVGKWLHFLDSTQVYALTAIKALNDHYQPKDRFQNVDDKEYVGRNIATMYRLPEFIGYYFAIQGVKYRLSYFTQQYEEYMFKGERLAHYFGSKHNHAALLFSAVASGLVQGEEIGTGIFAIGVFDKDGPYYEAKPYAIPNPEQVVQTVQDGQ